MMVHIKGILVLVGFPIFSQSFNPLAPKAFRLQNHGVLLSTTAENTDVADSSLFDDRSGKPTGTSYLPESTIERARDGSPIEKIKLEKDGTSAFVDVYEYARKIRNGEMTWEEVEKSDLDTVRYRFLFHVSYSQFFVACVSYLRFTSLSMIFIEIEMGRDVAPGKTYTGTIHDAFTCS